MNKLNEVITKIADMPETKTYLDNTASIPIKGTPAEMITKLEKDIVLWSEVAKAGNIVPQIAPRPEIFEIIIGGVDAAPHPPKRRELISWRNAIAGTIRCGPARQRPRRPASINPNVAGSGVCPAVTRKITRSQVAAGQRH